MHAGALIQVLVLVTSLLVADPTLLRVPGPSATEPAPRSVPMNVGAELAAHGARSPLSSSPVLWTNLSHSLGSPAPELRCCSSMVYDARDGYAVLYGGTGSCTPVCNRTWIERGSSWTELPTLKDPPAREWASMAYDPFDQEVVLYGGLSVNGSAALADTWTFSGGNWTELYTLGPPPARWAGAMDADLEDGYLLLFGGYTPAAGFLSDTWSFVNGSWQEIFPVNAPPARWTPAMSYDPEMGSMVLFGGFSGLLGFLGDTWTYSAGEWQQLAPSISPPDREKAVVGYDAADQVLVLFGGDSCPLGCGKGLYLRLLNDTWTMSGGTWTNATRSVGPPSQCCAAGAYAWDQGALLLVSVNGTRGRNATTWSAALSQAPPGRPEVASFEVQPSAATTAAPITFVVEARPSQGLLSYAYRGLPPGCLPSNTALLSCVVSSAGTYPVHVVVTDGSGANVSLSVSVTVAWGARSPPPPSAPLNLLPFEGAALVGAALIVVALELSRWRAVVRRRARKKVPRAPRPSGPPPSASDGKEMPSGSIPENGSPPSALPGAPAPPDGPESPP